MSDAGQGSGERTALVVGASRGLGRGIAVALAQGGVPVVAIARNATDLAELANAHPNIRPEVADAADAEVAARLLEHYRPEIVILVAGASPPMRPLHEHSWDTFSVNWHTDVRIAFHWLRQALLMPLAPGSRVVVISSGAAVAGSPLSGGYAGAKGTQHLITGYAQGEADRAGLQLSFTAVLPQITPQTALGLAAVRAYSARDGLTEEEYLEPMGKQLTPEIAGAAVLSLAQLDSSRIAPKYLLTGDGLRPLP